MDRTTTRGKPRGPRLRTRACQWTAGPLCLDHSDRSTRHVTGIGRSTRRPRLRFIGVCNWSNIAGPTGAERVQAWSMSLVQGRGPEWTVGPSARTSPWSTANGPGRVVMGARQAGVVHGDDLVHGPALVQNADLGPGSSTSSVRCSLPVGWSSATRWTDHRPSAWTSRPVPSASAPLACLVPEPPAVCLGEGPRVVPLDAYQAPSQGTRRGSPTTVALATCRVA